MFDLNLTRASERSTSSYKDTLKNLFFFAGNTPLLPVGMRQRTALIEVPVGSVPSSPQRFHLVGLLPASPTDTVISYHEGPTPTVITDVTTVVVHVSLSEVGQIWLTVESESLALRVPPGTVTGQPVTVPVCQCQPE
eukprot:1977657-Rhodomonas_salina.1